MSFQEIQVLFDTGLNKVPVGVLAVADHGDSFVSGNGPLPAGYTHWMVKFSGEGKGGAHGYGRHEGALEHICLLMAGAAGITVPEFKLIDDGTGVRHLAVRRFDRPTPATRRDDQWPAACRLPAPVT
jgi:hypothetical protein